MRNTLIQLGSQIATTAFTAGLMIYLVRALGPTKYGLYALAYGVGTLLLLPAGFGLPWAVGRFIADHRENAAHARAILRLGLKLQIPAALIVSGAQFALAAPIAHAYGHPGLVWPLRWMSVALFGSAMFNFLTAMVSSVRQSGAGLWMVLIESATETSTAIALVALGAGVSGAMLGKAIGYTVATIAGVFLTLRLLGGLRSRGSLPAAVTYRAVTRYAGAMLIVDATWSAIGTVDVLLIGALLSSAAVGSFSAVMKILTVLGYLGIAVSGGVAPRLSLGGGSPDTKAFSQAVRYLIVIQGLVLAPMIVWATPIVDLTLGSSYHSSPEIMRVLSVQAFVSAPGALVAMGVTYMGEGRRRVPIMFATLVIGLVATYILLRTIGLVGAAIADDLVQVVYIVAHFWICSRLIPVDLRGITRSVAKTVLAACAMGVPLFAIGTGRLNVGQWVGGGCAGLVLYIGALLLTREISVDELRALLRRLPLPAALRP